ncbi:MAG: glutamate--tRNA ligase [Candidatus Aenigmarchaeota archaeon]|nr:glutamate--tRNA ligase [Candidatus Aenigmarchaeota archaeon]
MKELILKHVLINALEHDGKADLQAVIGKVLSEDESLKYKIKEAIPEIKRTVQEVNSLSIEKQRERLHELGATIKKPEAKQEGLPELSNAEVGKVVLRLAPFPSGPLHIGNSRMVVLNDEYAKKYKGKLLLVIDDTIGSEEKHILPESYKLIEDGLKWLGVKYHKKIYKSDRLKIFYAAAEQIIKKDAAYVCECDAETLRKNRSEGIACKHRSASIDETLKKWRLMLKGKYKEGKAVLRLKTDMRYPNPAFRDRVLLRVSERKHPRVGKKYKVWPMLEFSWAVDDYMLGVTHIIRGKDLVIEDMMEEFIWNLMGWNKPEIIHYGSLRIGDAKLSKTEARKAIEKGVYSDWDDPRTWSIQSLAKRGIQPEAIRNFVIKMGLSMADVAVPEEILYAENRKLVDAKANRYFAVFDPLEISVAGDEVKNARINLHPDFPKRGKRKIAINLKKIYVERGDFDKFFEQEVGLINLLSIKLKRNSKVTSNDVKYEIPKIHWVSEPNAKIKVLMPNGEAIKVLAEPSVKKLKVGELVQFYRVGFCRVDKTGKQTVLYFTHK